MIAYLFHFPPSELWDMDAADLAFWAARGEEIAEYRNG
ncbi:GpE family phage tail protein [Halomonas sp. ND22Bw]